nr:Chain I, HAEMADIN [Haemadipsa sylvestris]1E0F_J Chain J, HAEMADIN [Haemadipsa sylvestris]1E0F_K Chain K, HAEMADIN [Haemadipsa sylvestris]
IRFGMGKVPCPDGEVGYTCDCGEKICLYGQSCNDGQCSGDPKPSSEFEEFEIDEEEK